MTERFIRGAITPQGVLDVRVQGHRIVEVGAALAPASDAEVIDARDCVLWPGLVNTHHHLAQSILKGMPVAIDSGLADWLPLVPLAAWPHLTPEAMYAAARVGFAELLRAGCTTCADHHYLYARDTAPEIEAALFQAAEEVGIRFVLCRGGQSEGMTRDGLNASELRGEGLDLWLARLESTVADHHDPAPDAMTRVVVAPTSLVHAAAPEDLRALAAYARRHGLRMHSHLLEIQRDEAVARAMRGLSAVDFAESVDWLGPDVWFAHLVHADAAAIAKLGRTRTGIAHCPVSNCRLGSGVAPVPAMAAAGMQISIGVDGSASAESGSLVNELMQAWLVHRAVGGANATRVEQVLHWGTRGGAELLGLDTGRLEAGACADLVLFDLGEPRFHGVWAPHQAPLICGEPVHARRVMVNGRWVVEDGRVLGIDYAALARSAARERARLQALLV